jgi:hypothetical protein
VQAGQQRAEDLTVGAPHRAAAGWVSQQAGELVDVAVDA